MFCRNCGSEVREGSKFCSKCGSVLSAAGAAAGNSKPAVGSQTAVAAIQREPLVSVDMGPADVVEVTRRKRFGKEEQYCSLCNTNLTFTELADGYICDSCKDRLLPLAQRYRNITIENAQKQMKMQQTMSDRGMKFKMSDGVEPYFAIDKENHLAQVLVDNNSYIYLPWGEIISFQLLEDGKVVSRKGVGGALVGGALLGATGAVIGSAAGSKHKEKTTQLAVKIVTRNEFFPQIEVDLINFSVKTGSRAYKNAAADAQKILSLLTIIADSVQNTQGGGSPLSTAEEIKKYKILLDEGILSQREFDSKKAQLLGL